jgi:hypothetical protein
MSFEAEVNAAIAGVTKNDEGKIIYPEGTSEAAAFAANAELRRRDTQSALTKEQQKAELLAKENEKLASTWASEVSTVLSADQQAVLEELKNTDVEAWRKKITEFERANKEAFRVKRTKVSEAVKNETELQRRTRLVEEHNKANPDAAITDDFIKNDLPPRITAKLANGDITFDQFLAEAAKYKTTPKVVGQKVEAPADTVDLSALGGDNKPTSKSIEQDIVKSYSSEIY